MTARSKLNRLSESEAQQIVASAMVSKFGSRAESVALDKHELRVSWQGQQERSRWWRFYYVSANDRSFSEFWVELNDATEEVRVLDFNTPGPDEVSL